MLFIIIIVSLKQKVSMRLAVNVAGLLFCITADHLHCGTLGTTVASQRGNDNSKLCLKIDEKITDSP